MEQIVAVPVSRIHEKTGELKSACISAQLSRLTTCPSMLNCKVHGAEMWTDAEDQPGVLIHGSESETEEHEDEEEKPCEEHENNQDEDEGETGQQDRMSDDAAQRRSDMCDKSGKSDKMTQSHEQEICGARESRVRERGTRSGKERD